MNLDLTSSSSRTQKNTTQKKSYKPKKSNTNNTRKSNISIHFPPPKASHNLSSKKKSCNQSISQPKIIRAPPSPLQVRKISNPTILARVSGEFSCASSTPLRVSYVRWGCWGSPFTFTSTPGENSKQFRRNFGFLRKKFRTLQEELLHGGEYADIFFSMGFSCMDWSKGCVFMWVLL